MIKVLPKISTEGMTAEDVTTLSDRVRLMMLETYYEISPHMERLAAEESEEVPERKVSDAESVTKPEVDIKSSEGETLLKTKTDELETSKHIDTVPDQEQQTKVSSSNDTNGKDQTKLISEQIEIGENLQKDERTTQMHSSGESSSNQNQRNEESATDSDLTESTLLVDLSEPEPKNTLNSDELNRETKLGDNDESPSSQASSDSFVFVNSSKLDEDTNSESKNETNLENVGEEKEVSPEEVSTRDENVPEKCQRVEEVSEKASDQKESGSHVEECEVDSSNLE